MSRLRYNRRQAVEHLRESCPDMGRFVRDCGPLKLRTATDPGRFSALARAIVYQQLSGKAAGTIHGRFSALFEQDTPTAAGTVDLEYEALRGAGLSNNKDHGGRTAHVANRRCDVFLQLRGDTAHRS